VEITDLHKKMVMGYLLCFVAGVGVGVLLFGLFVLIVIGITHEETASKK